MTVNNKQYKRRRAAAQYLQDNYGFGTAASLAKYAVTGGGPSFRKVGRMVLYEVPELDRWAQAKMSGPMRSTSDTEVE
jgi:hypothetical protein